MLVALLEVLGIGVIPLFIAILAEPGKVRIALVSIFPAIAEKFSTEGEILIFTCWVLIALFITKNTIVAVITSLQLQFLAIRQAKLSTRLLDILMSKSYAFHINRSSPILQRIVVDDSFSVYLGTLLPFAQLIIEVVVVVLIASILLISYPSTTAVTVVFFGVILFIFYRLFRERLTSLGKSQMHSSAEMVKWISQGLGGVKETKLLGREQYFVDAFNEQVKNYSLAAAYIGLISQTPRLFVETLVVCGMASAVLIMTALKMPVQEMLPSLALFGVAAIRLMPSVNRILASVTLIKVNQSALNTVLQTIIGTQNDPTGGTSPNLINNEFKFNFERSIRISAVDFSYPESSRMALDSVKVDIYCGEIFGIIGGSGAGKSSLVDILLGLLQPSAGMITADGENIFDLGLAWQRIIGYVPQSIYIADDTIRRNVAFGVPDNEIDDKLIWSALHNAQLSEYVQTLTQGLQTCIGEAGSRLSGGQRQRIGIARSLYGNPSLLIMDEATSALDNETENELGLVMQSLKGTKTLIVVAHRLNTVKRCDRLLYLRDGRVAGVGTYQTLFEDDPGFRRLMGELNRPVTKQTIAE